ncbi:P-loop containing nucleoside triphosphate hydrolase protein [Ilyonectria robusta]|uniref:P-loop containing nucleoside triphosphate hydrolase protein n=1 Tax=Ilyonectria robusta TaxID=1079257 RepID=UPI001E8DF2CD|nr:P-loop containing nucleoside triphosphate hydrolase protein [Ilyonectria robusta]KAH8667874.1 P-loop containing nucleoside triphosphate hydrolase protein [Ilyonectria robusta]
MTEVYICEEPIAVHSMHTDQGKMALEEPDHSSDAKTPTEHLKDDTDGSVEPGEKTPAADTDKGEQGSEPEDIVGTSATLYCKINGRAHFLLLDFGVWVCPLCEEDLELGRSRRRLPRSGPEEAAKNDEPIPDVSYSIEYTDCANYKIARENWEGKFDLAVARKDVRTADRSVFEVVTVLETSLPDRRLAPFEVDELLKKGILTDPNIRITVSNTLVTIYSTALIQTIRNIVQYYPENLGGDVIELKAPYMLLGHHLNDLEAYLEAHRVVGPSGSDSSVDKTTSVPTKHAYANVGAEHLSILVEYFKEKMYKDMMEEKSRHDRNVCTFKMLWLLYRPGVTVYLESGGKLFAFVVNSLETSDVKGTAGVRRVKSYTINMWNLDFDSRFVGRRARTVTIPHFDGERRINSLKLFPCEFKDKEDGGEMRRSLEEHGKKWYELLRGGQVIYSGRLLDASKKQFQGRVVVDMPSYYAQEPSHTPEICSINDLGEELAKCYCEDCKGYRPHPPEDFPWTRYDLIDPLVDQDLEIPGSINGSRHRYALCARLLHGFDLKSRSWVMLDVECCQPPKMNVGAIETLVMPSERKEMIKALIHKFTDSNASTGPGSWRADFLENKGEGQIFLLHGSPGVGKTYTAECIAEYTGRPMLSLTVADIGTDEVIMEKQLVKWFQLAEKWGAVMLIDEADVFLEKRQVSDLKRNSLVSVFLRCIEYYRGVLFLTTNRVGQFDDAFMSRIHVVIYYDKLRMEDRRQIWSQFFNKLEDEREDFFITRRAKAFVLEDDTICEIEWNGREIRNAFQTAVSLAEYRFLQKPDKTKNDCPTLDQKDFEQVCKMVRQFKEYLVDVHGVDEDGRAFMRNERG